MHHACVALHSQEGHPTPRYRSNSGNSSKSSNRSWQRNENVSCSLIIATRMLHFVSMSAFALAASATADAAVGSWSCHPVGQQPKLETNARLLLHFFCCGACPSNGASYKMRGFSAAPLQNPRQLGTLPGKLTVSRIHKVYMSAAANSNGSRGISR